MGGQAWACTNPSCPAYHDDLIYDEDEDDETDGPGLT